MSDPKVFNEIRAQFSGTCPNVFVRMSEAGVLENHWPAIREAVFDPGALPPVVIEALFIVFSLRCANPYCFVIHSLFLVPHGLTAIAIEELGRVFDLPASVPEYERWSRVLKLSWLARLEGPQQAAADLMLQRSCSEAEHDHIMRVASAVTVLTGFTVESQVLLEQDPTVEQMPEELRRLVPSFVQFHTRMNRADPERPVAVMCSGCREVRSTDDQWYPFEVARKLLVDDLLFSHALCERCLDPQLSR